MDINLQSFTGSVLSTEADLACREIMTHQASTELAIDRINSGRASPRDEQDELLTGMVAIAVEVEGFTFSRVVKCSDQAVAAIRSNIVDTLYKPERSRLDRNWESICTASMTYLGANIRAFSPYREVMALVDVRNSAVHANGKVTRKQQSDSSLEKRLGLIGAEVIGGRIALSFASLVRAAKASRSFVMAVDGVTWAPPTWAGAGDTTLSTRR